MGSRAQASAQFQPSTKSRNWAAGPEDLSSVFVTAAPVSAPSIPTSAADLSPQTSSDSGERCACLLDFIAFSLSCFAVVLTHNQGGSFLSVLGKYFRS